MKLFTLEAELTLNTAGFNAAVSNARDQMGDMTNDLTGVASEAERTGGILESALGHAIGDFISNLGSQMGQFAIDFAGDSITIASAVEQTHAKLEALFGKEGAAEIRAWAETTKDQYGISAQAAKQYAADIAGLWGSEHLGFSDEELMNMATRLVELTGDLASFNNFSVAETWTKILSGMRGETEAIEDLGIDLRAASIAPYFDMKESDWGKLDQKDRILKTYEYALAMTAHAQGDFARTSDSYQNQLAMFNANIEELKGTLGDQLLPVLKDAVTLLNSFFGAGEDGSEAMKGISSELGETYATIDTTATNALALVEALRQMEEQGVDTADEQSMWNKLLEDLKSTLPGIGDLIDDTTGSINGGTKALENYVTEWQTMQREMAVASAMQSYQAEIAAQAQKVAQLELQRNITNMTDADAEARRMGYLQQAADYLFAGEEYNLADVTDILDLYDRIEASVEEGDSYAKYLSDSIDAIDDRDKNRQQLEADYLAATAQLEAMNQQMIAMQSQIEALLIGTGAKKPAATEGPEARGVPTPVNLSVQVIVDGEEVSAVLVPKVSGEVMNRLDWRFSQIAKG